MGWTSTTCWIIPVIYRGELQLSLSSIGVNCKVFRLTVRSKLTFKYMTLCEISRGTFFVSNFCLQDFKFSKYLKKKLILGAKTSHRKFSTSFRGGSFNMLFLPLSMTTSNNLKFLKEISTWKNVRKTLKSPDVISKIQLSKFTPYAN